MKRKHKEVLLYMISMHVEPKVVVEISKANWLPRIRHWASAPSGSRIELLIVEK